MSTASRRQERTYRHPAFDGLRDEELVSLYNITSVKKINAGEILVKEGSPDATVHLILDGSAKVFRKLNGRDIQITVLRQGQCMPQALFFQKGKRKESVIALEPLTVLNLDEGSLNVLPPNLQLAIHKNLSRLSEQQINDLVTEKIALSYRNNALTSQMANLLQSKSHKYADSEMIQSFLTKIPRLPMFTTQVAMMLFDENVSTRQIADKAKLDPSLVSAVLKTINSAYYGFQHRIADFQHALLLLGFNHIHQLVIDIGIRSTMPKSPEFSELQFHSVMVCSISFEIAKLFGIERSPTNSTIGLLHDIGKSVILLLRKQNPKMTLLIDELDHSKIGSLLLKRWNIPDAVCQCLEYQNYPKFLPSEEIPEEFRKNVAVLYISHLCYEYLQGKSENELFTPFLNEYMEVLGAAEGTISDLVRNELLPRLNKTLSTFPQNVRQFLIEGMNRTKENGPSARLDT
jgi:HD-like signal output (HDOD) protein